MCFVCDVLCKVVRIVCVFACTCVLVRLLVDIVYSNGFAWFYCTGLNEVVWCVLLGFAVIVCTLVKCVCV